MALTLFAHPLSSYCWKVLIALHEAGLPFDLSIVDLGDPEGARRFREISPFGKMPVLQDDIFGVTTPESTLIIEHLAAHYPSARGLAPQDARAAHAVRLWDRHFDNYVHTPMQKIVANRLVGEDQRDPFGVAQARAGLRAAYAVLDAHMGGRDWAAGAFSMADCAAAPALHYADRVEPMGAAFPALATYIARLEARPSVARVLSDAAPYAHMFPQEPA